MWCSTQCMVAPISQLSLLPPVGPQLPTIRQMFAGGIHPAAVGEKCSYMQLSSAAQASLHFGSVSRASRVVHPGERHLP